MFLFGTSQVNCTNVSKMEDDIHLREQDFHNAVREYIVTMLLFILLYISSYATICTYKRKSDKEDFYAGESEDATVYRVSLWLCTFTLAVSLAAVLLLPISIVANEVLLMYPKSYYMQWLNSSLIHGLWNYVFLFSNLALFVLMPFAYLFTESEGLPGSRRGIMSRVYETLLVLFLMAILVMGLAYVASAIIDNDASSKQALFDIWNFYLPYLYSCISLLGVLMLLICTPIGFARMFTVMGGLVVKPTLLRSIEEELHTVQFEEETLKRKLQHGTKSIANGHATTAELQDKLCQIQSDRRELERRKQTSSLRRNLGYPLVMLALLGLTAISVLLVAQNTLELLIGVKALPKQAKEMVLGLTSLSALGPLGATIEVVLILYCMSASTVGFYTLPLCTQLRPIWHDTSMTKVIGNCVVILILSSALPVLSRTLGITNFDLLGDFGRMEWLGNFYIILLYNVVFAVATALCLFTTFTSTLRRELYQRLRMAFKRERERRITTSVTQNGDASHIKED